jgi:hypothetical protein
MKIAFLQFLRPNGRRRNIEITLPDTDDNCDLLHLATDIRRAGCRLTAEELMTDEISLCIEHDEGDLAQELCSNGPEVIEAVKRLLRSWPSARLRINEPKFEGEDL